ncbi:dihydrofolate reductase family protein [Corallococcus macrosporus]|uniref:Riboflavin biosynthesis protein RibD domain-containing protein n=1 Tax=Myxococcus fulvus (strain ATCC BAA-855 / HW-1) TaxID=483219 RepID=F8CFB4_MYXFH|nr:dihydrofolate reductase family protein [Corallococcus macrosporus]AEI62422.1 riboflavin biosynthesis protein RibD domain-containing protein [Corallococcus macrosporus]
MRKLKYHVATSVDGFIAHEDDTYGAFMQTRLIQDSEHVTDFVASLATYSAALMGRRTYEVGLKEGVTDPYTNLETYVFSRTMKESPNPRVKLVSEDAVGAVRRLKAQEGGDIYLSGGGAFAGLLFAQGLVDEVLLKMNPLILGAGIPLVSSLRQVVDLELKSTKVYGNGVLLLRYAVLPRPKA